MSIGDRKITLTLPELGLIALTRGALGAGVGFLLSNLMEKNTRRGAGLALFAIGALTTVPLLMRVRAELR